MALLMVNTVDLGLFCGFLLDTGGEHLIPHWS